MLGLKVPPAAPPIHVAAVNAAAGEIYVNPLTVLSVSEWRFVMAHEMLHAALRHGERVGGRDPYLWNVAADLVINGWLLEMGVGTMPDGAEDYGLVLVGLEIPAPHGPGILRFSSGHVFVGQLRRSGLDDMVSVRLAETYDDPSDFFRNWANGRQFELVIGSEVIGPLRLNGTRRAMGALVNCAEVARTASPPPAGPWGCRSRS